MKPLYKLLMLIGLSSVSVASRALSPASVAPSYTHTEVFSIPTPTDTLRMDVYTPLTFAERTDFPCILYVFGGGFVTGERDSPRAVSVCDSLARMGFVVCALDYRLGLRDAPHVGVFHLRPLEDAILLAATDIATATAHVLRRVDALHISPGRIVLHGTSAGAIAALTVDHLLASRPSHRAVAALPDDFRYAAVVSYSGAIFSRRFKPSYRTHAPSPTLFFHGTADRLVPYRKMQFFHVGMFGTASLVPRFRRRGYSYAVYRYRDVGHEVANYMLPRLRIEADFLHEVLDSAHTVRTEFLDRCPSIPRTAVGSFRPSDLQKLK